MIHSICHLTKRIADKFTFINNNIGKHCPSLTPQSTTRIRDIIYAHYHSIIIKRATSGLVVVGEREEKEEKREEKGEEKGEIEGTNMSEKLQRTKKKKKKKSNLEVIITRTLRTRKRERKRGTSTIKGITTCYGVLGEEAGEEGKEEEEGEKGGG